MSQDATKPGDEWLGARLLQVALGAEVDPHDDGSRPSMYDLAVRYPDGRLAAAEVVSTRDRHAMMQLDAARARGYTHDARLTRSWRVILEERAKLKRVALGIVPLLLRLEADGIDSVGRGGWLPYREDLSAARIESCWSFEPTDMHPPGYYLWPPPKGAFVGDGEHIVRECDQFLATVPDVPARLVASRLPERHAVVVVTVDRFDLFVALESGALPTTPPTLPDGVDCLWLLTFKSPPMPAVYWLGDGIWRQMTLTDNDLVVAPLPGS
jgi:hypothetical protein